MTTAKKLEGTTPFPSTTTVPPIPFLLPSFHSHYIQLRGLEEPHNLTNWSRQSTTARFCSIDKVCLQCFDAIGWVVERASDL